MSVRMREIGALTLLILYFDPASIPQGLSRASQRLWRQNFGYPRDVHSSGHSADTTVLSLCHGFIVPVVKLWVQRCALLCVERCNENDSEHQPIRSIVQRRNFLVASPQPLPVYLLGKSTNLVNIYSLRSM